MNTLLRSATARFDPSPIDIYHPLDQGTSQELKKTKTRRFSSRRSSSSKKKRSSEQPIALSHSATYRRVRARHRQIFLKTYKLSSINSLKKSHPRKLVKRAILKLRKAVVRILSIARLSSIRSRSCISGAIRASPPIRSSCF